MATKTTKPTDDRRGDFYLHAVLGAVVTVLLSFVPFAPLLGGGLAGYLHDQGTGRGTRIGLVAGLVAAIPIALVFILVVTVMSLGTLATGEVAGPMFALFLVVAVLVYGGLYVVGLSAAGGYLGGAIAEPGAEPTTGETGSDNGPREYVALDESDAMPPDQETLPVDEDR